MPRYRVTQRQVNEYVCVVERDTPKEAWEYAITLDEEDMELILTTWQDGIMRFDVELLDEEEK